MMMKIRKYVHLQLGDSTTLGAGPTMRFLTSLNSGAMIFVPGSWALRGKCERILHSLCFTLRYKAHLRTFRAKSHRPRKPFIRVQLREHPSPECGLFKYIICSCSLSSLHYTWLQSIDGMGSLFASMAPSEFSESYASYILAQLLSVDLPNYI